MIEAKLIPNRSAYTQHSHPHFAKLNHHQRVGIKDETSCLHLCFPCICKEKYHLTSVEGGFYIGNILYTVDEEGCLCCKSFKVRNPENGDDVVGDWKQTTVCCCNPCGGPRMDVHDSSSAYIGHAFKPCQVCNYGIDVVDSGDNKEFYIGSNYDCCSLLCPGCSCFCECCKCMCSCCDCGDRIFRYPIWNAERTEEVGNLYHVITCMKLFVPCLGSRHSIVEFPGGTNDIQKLRVSAGSFLFDRTVIPHKRNTYQGSP